MRTWTLAFLLGVVLLQQFAFLPSQSWLVVIAIFTLSSAFFLIKKWRYGYIVIAILLGFTWSLWYAHSLLDWSVPKEWEGQPLLVSGYIASVPNVSEHQTHFLFATQTIQTQPIKKLIKLSWQNNPVILHAGEKWQWVVRLKRIHGLMNPGGFDYEAWALQDGIRANGYIVAATQNKLLSNNLYHYPLSRLRQHLKEKIEKVLPISNTSPWITALALGERQNIAPENWEVLRNTGTNHLMAIAGLHIGFMASFVFLLVSVGWRRIAWLTLRVPAPYAGAIAALGVAILYSALAGFSIPTQRACIMLSLTLITLVMRRVALAWQTWSVALFCVLLINPLSVLTESFWLSFGSVALIIYGVSGRLAPKGLWWKLGRIQWVIAVGLIPLSVYLFQQFSLVAFIANSIAIPVVGFVIVPLTLFGCLFLTCSAKIGGNILHFADQVLSMLWAVLNYLSHLPWATWYQVIPVRWVSWVASLGMIILLLPRGFYGRYFGVIGLLPLIFYPYTVPASGEVWFNLLDVGQGLSAVLQTHNHILVFDAGPRLSDSYDMGASVVTPFLRAVGAKKIDLLVISHGDNDHLGGAAALFKNFVVRATRTSDPSKLLPFPSQYCLRGEAWQWDGVQFAFIYPSADKLNLDNNSSCVLQVTSASHHTILLTGDIEKQAEKNLLALEGAHLAADVLVAPHHGSKTSALDAFIDAVHPQYVLFPVGYRNRYHFPTASVVKKYQQRKIRSFATDQSGAIQIVQTEQGLKFELYRQTHKHYWN